MAAGHRVRDGVRTQLENLTPCCPLSSQELGVATEHWKHPNGDVLFKENMHGL